MVNKSTKMHFDEQIKVDTNFNPFLQMFRCRFANADGGFFGVDLTCTCCRTSKTKPNNTHN